MKSNWERYRGQRLQLGDIALSFDRIRAEIKGELFYEYVYYLFIHAFLHLLGYVHDTSTDQKEMAAIEAVILKKLGISIGSA